MHGKLETNHEFTISSLIITGRCISFILIL